jgi:acyl carrier protein
MGRLIMDLLTNGLKKMVIKECSVQGVLPDDIANDAPIIGGDGALQLDSLDAVEIVTALERNFNIRFETANASRPVFKSFATMAEYVSEHTDRAQLENFIKKSAD